MSKLPCVKLKLFFNLLELNTVMVLVIN